MRSVFPKLFSQGRSFACINDTGREGKQNITLKDNKSNPNVLTVPAAAGGFHSLREAEVMWCILDEPAPVCFVSTKNNIFIPTAHFCRSFLPLQALLQTLQEIRNVPPSFLEMRKLLIPAYRIS